MHSALNSGWLPDRKLLTETADWISGRLPWWLRWAPLFSVVIIAALATAARVTEIPVPRKIPIAVQETGTTDSGPCVVLHAPFKGDLPAIGSKAVLRVSSRANEQVTRLAGTIVNLAPAPGMVIITVSIKNPLTVEGSGVLLVPADSESLWDILLRKLQAQGVGR